MDSVLQPMKPGPYMGFLKTTLTVLMQMENQSKSWMLLSGPMQARTTGTGKLSKAINFYVVSTITLRISITALSEGMFWALTSWETK